MSLSTFANLSGLILKKPTQILLHNIIIVDELKLRLTTKELSLLHPASHMFCLIISIIIWLEYDDEDFK